MKDDGDPPRAASDEGASARPLFIVDRFPVYSETFVMNEILGLRAMGVDVQVFALGRGDAPLAQAIPVTWSSGVWPDARSLWPARPRELRLHLGSLLRCFGGRPRWFLYGLLRTGTVLHAAHRARTTKCTSIHAHFLGATAVVGACAAAVVALPLTLSPHASLEIWPRPTLRRLLQRAAFTIACWRGAERFLSQLGPRVYYAPHGTNRAPRSAPRPNSTSEMHFVAIGRLVPKKGIAILLEAAELLVRERSDWHLTIVGDGPLRRSLEARARSGPAARSIRFHGAASHDEVSRILETAHVLAVPSVITPGTTEGIPNVILEAFARGLPVVASNVGGIGEVVVPGVTGILVPPGSPNDLAAALLRVLRGEEPLHRYAEAAAELVAARHRSEDSLQLVADLHRSLGRESSRSRPSS